MKSRNLQLSLIIPALNEQANIANTIEDAITALKEFDILGELVVVNDGSTDRTKEIVEEKIKKYPNKVSLVNHKKNKGVGASFWSGADKAKGEVVVMHPGDNENDAREILKFFWLIKEVDLVIPFVFNKEVRSVSRRRLSMLYTYFINVVFFTKLNYTNGTTLYRKSLLKNLQYRATGFFYQADILIRLIKSGYLYAEVPHRLSTRAGGKSSAFKLRSILSFFKESIILFIDCYIKRDLKLKTGFPKDTITFQKKKNE